MPSVFEGFVGFVIAASDGEVGPLGTGLDGTPGSEGLAASVTGSESSCPKLPPSDGTPGSEPGTALEGLEGLEGNPSDGSEGLCAFNGSEGLLALDGLSGVVGLLGSPGSEGVSVLPSRPDSVLLKDDGKFPLCPVVVANWISSYVSGISPSPAC